MDKRVVFGFFFSVLILSSFASAISVDYEDKGSVIIKELGNPATFNFKISSGIADTYEIYSFLGVTFSPRGSFDLPSGTSNVEVKVYPSKDVLSLSGFYNFEYQIIGQQSGIFEDDLQIKLVSLEQTLELTAEPLEVTDDIARIKVTNTQNTRIDNANIVLKSPFFESSQTISLEPFKSTTLEVPVDKEKQKGMKAGQYLISGDVSLQSAQARLEGRIDYVEQELIEESTETAGVIVRDSTITQSNNGNIESVATTTIKRDALSRLFTTFSVQPIKSERNGFVVTYIWETPLKPGEQSSVVVTTNYTLPFIVLILIAVVVVLVRRTTVASINVAKQVSFVRTKGGEFALKVTLTVNSDKNVENIQLIDTVPAVMKLYHKYGRSPDRVDAQTRRLFWDIDRLSAGESRVYSYIIYSNIRVMGRFELPSAVAVFDQNGKTHEVYSNRAFFATTTAQS